LLLWGEEAWVVLKVAENLDEARENARVAGATAATASSSLGTGSNHVESFGQAEAAAEGFTLDGGDPRPRTRERKGDNKMLSTAVATTFATTWASSDPKQPIDGKGIYRIFVFIGAILSHKLSGDITAPSSQLHTAVMLALLVVGH
jgi:hypothetical protein